MVCAVWSAKGSQRRPRICSVEKLGVARYISELGNSMTLITHQPLVSRRRSLANAIATVDTFAASCLIIGRLRWARSIVSVAAISNKLFYYIQEHA